jgi:CRISPR-associated endonuclease/helicase Cas3
MKCGGYWGKTNAGQYHRLLYHNLDATACAIRLIERSDRLAKALMEPLKIDRINLANLVGWATLLHDLGKLSPTFQYQSPETSTIAHSLGVSRIAQSYDVRHDSLGWALWQDCSASMRLDVAVLDSMDSVMRCATGHHGKPPSNVKNGTRVSTSRYFGPDDVLAGRELIEWSLVRFKPTFPAKSAIDRASWWIAGVITLADWMGSNTEWFPFKQSEIPVEDYLQCALTNADIAIDVSGVVMPTERKSFSDLFKGYTPTSVQQAVFELPIQEKPFFLAIEETTGGGKTEAALAAASGSSLFFGLPTMATANGLWRRVKSLEGQQSLLHSKRWMMPDAMDRATAWLNDSGRKSLLSDIGVGTIDQAMIAAMYARYSTLRLAGLAAKTLIIDEVHAYDVYMKRILEVLIELHAKSQGSVILLSATLPLQHRLDYAKAWTRGRELHNPLLVHTGFPLITFVDSNGRVTEREDLKSRYEDDVSNDANASAVAGRH